MNIKDGRSKHRMRFAALVVALLVTSGATAFAQQRPAAPEGSPAVTAVDRSITQQAVGGARLGLRREAYVRVYGGPVRLDRLEGGLTRLVFTRLDLEVYLRGNTGVAINTFGRSFRTSEGVRPCSPARALMAAYGERLRQLPTSGPVSLYRLGNLVFRVAAKRVGAVVLGSGSLSVLIAGNSSDCGRG